MGQRSPNDRRSVVGMAVGQLPTPLAILNRYAFTRYFMASLVSLAFDMAVFMTFVSLNMKPAVASAIGYLFGVSVHWIISSTFVFPGKTRTGRALNFQIATFFGTALLGLGITVGIVATLTGWGLLPVLAKIAAVAVSFVVVYLIRKFGVFQ